MKRVFRVTEPGKVKDIGLRGLGTTPEVESLDVKVALIQALIPIGLQAVQELLEAEVAHLAGARHQRIGRQPGLVRWGQQRGSVYLADQKLAITHTRVRDRVQNQEVPLRSYHALQTPRQADAGLFRKLLLGLSCRDYAAAAEAVPTAFGLSASTVSRRFIQASAAQLQAFQERNLGAYDVVALALDGKTFARDSMVIALGITLTGEKIVLGFVQTATENERVCAAFLRQLVDRGLRVERGLLVVLDGAKGLRAAVTSVFGAQAAVQRCQWHKRENVVAYLPKGLQDPWRRKLQAAYECPTYGEAKACQRRFKSPQLCRSIFPG
jgi:transposase-like protein